MITKTTVHRAFVGNKEGWAFCIYWDNRPYANIASALYKTKRTASEKLAHYIKTGKFETYGDAE